MWAPSAVSASTSEWDSRQRSRKNVTRDRLRRALLVPERFFDLIGEPVVVLRELRDGVAGLIALGDDRSRNAGALQAWPAELDTRVDHDGYARGLDATGRKGVEPNG